MKRMDEMFKNAWHNVRGISSEEMLKAAEDAQRLYGDIIDLPHPVSKKHPPLTMQQKAAQFSPFAALSGYEEAIDETGRLTQEKLSLGEDRRAQLDEQLQKIVKSMEMQQKTDARIKEQPQNTGLRHSMKESPQVSFTYFVPDHCKDGGQYLTVSGAVRKIDGVAGRVILASGLEIPVEDIYDISFGDLPG